MSVVFNRVFIPGGMPVFWRGEAKVLPGDFKLKQTFAEGDLIRQGTPLQLDFANMEAAVVKVAKVLAGGSTTAPRVTKGTLLRAGDVVMKLGKGDISPVVVSVNTTNADYDVVTLSAAISGLTAGDFLQECSAYSDAAAETTVQGVHTLTIGTKPAAGDKLSLDGVVYEFAAAEGDAVYAIGSDAKGAAANIEDAVSAQYDGVFSVVAKNGKIIFTQLVGGVGALPVLVVTPAPSTGTLAATIATTTEGVAAVGAVEASPLYVADAVVETTKKYETNGFQTVSAAYEVVILKEVAYPIPASWLEGFSLRSNHGIKYIKQ